MTASTSSSSASPHPRARLEHQLDRYLEALVAHDPSRAPLAKAIKYTENGQRLVPGDGFWRTAGARESYRLVIPDVATNQVAAYLLMREHAWPVWVALRLRLEEDRIVEAEALIKREGGLFSTDRTAPDPIWLEAVPIGARGSREELIAAGERYFEALEKNLVDHAPIAEACERITNGMQMTHNPALNPFRLTEEQLARYNITGMSCRDNVNSPVWHYITRIERRFPVVDEERGIVVSIAVFQCNGENPTVELPHVGRIDLPEPFRRPFSALLQETFKIERGEIVSIVVVGEHVLPYGFRCGWE